MIAVDTIGFLNRVTGHQLLLWKVIATSIVFVLAGLQVLMAARFYDKTSFPASAAAPRPACTAGPGGWHWCWP